jgi:hypothetical protein
LRFQLLALLSFSIIFLSTSYEPPAHAQSIKLSATVPLTTPPNEREQQHSSTSAPFLLASPFSHSKNPLSGRDRNLSSLQMLDPIKLLLLDQS